MSLNLAPPMIDPLEIVLDLLSRPATSPAEKLFSDSFIKWLRDGDERPLQSALRLRGTPRREAGFLFWRACVPEIPEAPYRGPGTAARRALSRRTQKKRSRRLGRLSAYYVLTFRFRLPEQLR